MDFFIFFEIFYFLTQEFRNVPLLNFLKERQNDVVTFVLVRETSQIEVRLGSNLDGPFNFTTGAFFQEDETEFCVLQVVGFGSPSGHAVSAPRPSCCPAPRPP